MSQAQQESTSTQRVAIYTRISDDADKSGEGVARQKKDCLKRVEREDGWRLVKIFKENDTGASRQSKKKRPEYAAMLAMVERGDIDVILAYSNSRLTRRQREFLDLVELHERTGVEIRTVVSGDDDLGTAEGLMVAGIKANVDSAETDRISERVLRSVKERVEEGIWLGGPRPFGWKASYVEQANGKTTKTVYKSLDGVEAALVSAAITYIIEGVTHEDGTHERGTIGQVIRLWTELAIPTASGGKVWRHVGVNRILTRWSNAAIMEHKGKPLFDVKTSVPAICSRKELEQVRAVLLDPARSRGPGGTPKHLLSGIPVCGKCGHPLLAGAVTSRGKHFELYRCSGPGCYLAMLRKDLDHVVVQHVLREYRNSPASRFESAKTEARGLIAEAYRERATVQAERREVEEIINEGLTSVTAMRPRLVRLAEQDLKLTQEIERHYREDAHAVMLASVARVWHPTGDAPASEFTKENPEVAAELEAIAKEQGRKRGVSIMEAAVGMLTRWEAMPLEARRKLIKALFVVTVQPGRGDDRVEIVDRT